MPNPNEGNEKQTDNSKDTNNEDKTKTDQTYELNVGGESRRVTLEEMQELAQKSAGADKKFQDAADLRKEAENGLRIAELVNSLSENPSESDAQELATRLKIDPAEFAAYLKEGDTNANTQDDKENKTKSTGKLSKEELADVLTKMGLDPEEVKATLDFSRQRHIDTARQEIKNFTNAEVDKDKVFGKMIVGAGDKKEERLSVIRDMVAEDVLTRIQKGDPFGADLVAKSIQKIRSQLTKFGIPSNPVEYPVNLGLGPGGGLPSEVQAEEPIKRVSSAEDDGEENFVARAIQKTLKGLRSSRQT